MKKVCSILIFLSFNNFLFAQSKKEIIANQKSKIAVLEDKIRTLDFELSESNSIIEEFVDYNTEIINESKSLKNALQKCDQNNASLNDTLNNLIQKLTTLKSLENELILTPELFLISEDGFKYSLDANGNMIWDDKMNGWVREGPSIMGFVIGQECPPEFKMGNFSITKESVIKMGYEAYEFEVDIYYVKLGEELLLEIQDYGSTGFIEFITVFSDRFKTNKGIGVGSTVSEYLESIKELDKDGSHEFISIPHEFFCYGPSLNFNFGIDFFLDLEDSDLWSIEEPLMKCTGGTAEGWCSVALEAIPETKISIIKYGDGCPH